LSEDEYAALRGFCDELGMQWGRLDFLQDECGLIFLEFNANGQWAWLDLNGHYGLTDAVVSYLSTPPTGVNNVGDMEMASHIGRVTHRTHIGLSSRKQTSARSTL
jgi:hypothetical protein